MKWLFVTLFLLFTVNANAIYKTKIGLAPFAIAHKRFNCNAFLKSLENQQTINIAWLYNTFGRKYTCLKRVLKDSRLKNIETQLTNGPKNWIESTQLKAFIQKYNKCDVVFLWVAEYNCININSTKFVPPLQRICNQGNVNALIGKALDSF